MPPIRTHSKANKSTKDSRKLQGPKEPSGPRFRCDQNAPPDKVLRCRLLNLIDSIDPEPFRPNGLDLANRTHKNNPDVQIIHQEEFQGIKLIIASHLYKREHPRIGWPPYHFRAVAMVGDSDNSWDQRIEAVITFTDPYGQSANWTGRAPQGSWKNIVHELKNALARYGVNGDEIKKLDVQDPY